MTTNRRVVAIAVVCLTAGWWLGSSPASPVGPTPARPVLHRFARLTRTAARLGLWFALAGETPQDRPQSPGRPQSLQGDERQLVRAKTPSIGADGLEELDHAEGW
ncbi:MAG: hypothetical protein WCJ31_15035 [Planctomycetia bacterium]